MPLHYVEMARIANTGEPESMEATKDRTWREADLTSITIVLY
jgi:hypothetical protein